MKAQGGISMIKVIYFDKVFPDMVELIESIKPSGVTVTYWYTLNDKEKEQALNSADYFLVALYKITQELIQKAPKLKMIQKNWCRS